MAGHFPAMHGDDNHQTGPGSVTFLSGMDRTRVPVAADTALATAGAVSAVPGSPIPPHLYAEKSSAMGNSFTSQMLVQSRFFMPS